MLVYFLLILQVYAHSSLLQFIAVFFFSMATVEVQAKALLGKYFEKFGKVSSDSDLRRLEKFLSHTHAS